MQEGKLLFAGITDRGPNMDGPVYKKETKTYSTKIFPVPTFIPAIVYFEIDPASLNGKVSFLLPLKNEKGKPITGLPIPEGFLGSTLEVAINLSLQDVGTDSEGLDPEALRLDLRGEYFWISDEYGPFVAKVERKSGKIVQKMAPGQGLPEILAKRQANRGMEGLAITPNGKIYGIIQSILDVDGKVKDSKAPFVRMVEIDPATGKTRQFAVPIDAESYKRARDSKIGDLVALTNTDFLLIEQGSDKNQTMRNILYRISIQNATDVTGLRIEQKELEQVISRLEDFEKYGITPTSKKPVMDLREYGWMVEKAEGIAVIDSKNILIISDNDFGIAPQVLNPLQDKEGKSVTDPTAYELRNGRLSIGDTIGDTRIVPAPNKEATQLWLVSFDIPLF
ncbi:MAG: esterase-like activity of phytase family protein, partial [Breznakiellaceae bacterium]